MRRGQYHTSAAKEKNRLAHLGRCASPETKSLLSQIRKEKPNSGQFQKGQDPWNKGTKGLVPSWNKGRHNIYSEETLTKMSLAKRGKSPANKGVPATEEQKLKNSLAHKDQVSFWEGKTFSEEHIKHLRESHMGQVAWNKGIAGPSSHCWKGGKSFEPYTVEFTNQLKELIRLRDNYTCQLCGIPQQECLSPLAIHHIDYEKDNCLPSNLISLCNQCHSRTNHRRDIWQQYLEELAATKEIASACS